MSQRFPWRLVAWYLFFVVMVFGLDLVRYQHHSFFYLFPHFDKFLHTCAGIACGIFGWILIEWLAPALAPMQKFFIIMGITIFVGVGWEILERLFPLLDSRIMPFDIVDTTTDILSDILGGLLLFTYTLL